ncbi:MAG: DUF2061 domain-containing protein [Nanoarchaeota archaeon]|nr:DUF2061 domain-containing protein [Nanoarchaeota archaeon]MBU1632048.1 DUF2061 domain-containing protein [Nanoarchaeota archaeon]MBU1875539.1 DUF2061 domain-containing protein [Nanoarchaeota archaeon]
MNNTKYFVDSWKRSLVKTISYRLMIIFLDFSVVFLFTHKYEIAIGFVIISNLYTTGGYYIHERIWDKIKFGKIRKNRKNK